MADVSASGGLEQGRTYKTAAISAGALGDNTVIAAVTGKRIKVYAIVFNATGTVNAIWKDGAAVNLSGDMNFQAREGFAVAVTPPAYLLATAAGNAFILNLSAAVATDGWVAYWDEDAA